MAFSSGAYRGSHSTVIQGRAASALVVPCWCGWGRWSGRLEPGRAGQCLCSGEKGGLQQGRTRRTRRDASIVGWASRARETPPCRCARHPARRCPERGQPARQRHARGHARRHPARALGQACETAQRFALGRPRRRPAKLHADKGCDYRRAARTAAGGASRPASHDVAGELGGRGMADAGASPGDDDLRHGFAPWAQLQCRAARKGLAVWPGPCGKGSQPRKNTTVTSANVGSSTAADQPM